MTFDEVTGKPIVLVPRLRETENHGKKFAVVVQAEVSPVINEARRPIPKMAVNLHGKRSDKDFESGAFHRVMSGDSSWIRKTGPKIGNRGGGHSQDGGRVLNAGYTLVDAKPVVPLSIVKCKGCGIPMYPNVGCKGCNERRKTAKAIGAPIVVRASKGRPAVRRLLTREEAELKALLKMERTIPTEDKDILDYRKRRKVELAFIIEKQRSVA